MTSHSGIEMRRPPGSGPVGPSLSAPAGSRTMEPGTDASATAGAAAASHNAGAGRWSRSEARALCRLGAERLTGRLASLGLTVAIETDFRALTRLLREAGQFVYPAFDPARSTPGAEAFWLRVRDGAGRTVACHADRLFPRDRLERLVAEGRLWFDTPPPADPRTEILALPEEVAGRLGHSGSLWVAPDRRGEGLSVYLPYLSRCLVALRSDPDYFTGLVFADLAGSPVPKQGYGYPRVVPVLRGPFPPTGRPAEVHACWISGDESLDALVALADHPRFAVAIPRPAAGRHAIIGKPPSAPSSR
ncbi:MAG: hypothetical protein RID91_23070 [Azospirillaceae bacterium]